MRAAAPVLAVLMAGAGCAGETPMEATTVLNYDQCQGLEPGVTRVDYQAVAGIRGSTLLNMSDEAAPQAAEDDLVLIAISRGRQPTPGYGLSLVGAHREEATAVIEVRWQTPESGAVLPQMITHPCLVVGLTSSDFQHVEVRTRAGESLGSLAL